VRGVKPSSKKGSRSARWGILYLAKINCGTEKTEADDGKKVPKSVSGDVRGGGFLKRRVRVVTYSGRKGASMKDIRRKTVSHKGG